MAFHSIKPAGLTENIFDLIGKDWFLMSAEKEGRVNPMTVARATMGIFMAETRGYVRGAPGTLHQGIPGCGGGLFPHRI